MAIRSDVCTFVKGKHSKGSGKDTDVCKNCDKKDHWTRDCRGPRGGTEHGIQGYDGNRSNTGKGAAKKFDDNFSNCGKYDHKSVTCLTTRPTKLAEKGHGSKGKRRQASERQIRKTRKS